MLRCIYSDTEAYSVYIAGVYVTLSPVPGGRPDVYKIARRLCFGSEADPDRTLERKVTKAETTAQISAKIVNCTWISCVCMYICLCLYMYT